MGIEIWLLLPHLTLVLGIFSILAMRIWGAAEVRASQTWFMGLLLFFALCQQLLLYRVAPITYMRGGMAHDPFTAAMSVAVLVTALCFHLTALYSRHSPNPQYAPLFLGLTELALLTLQVNRIFIGMLALLGLVWSAYALLGLSVFGRQRSELATASIQRVLLFTTVSAIGSAILYALFGETQIDELQRMIGRPILGRDVLLTLQLIFVFLLVMVLGAPPFHGLLSVGRFGGTPQTRAFVTSILGLTGASVFMRWALAVFSRSGVGGLDLEPLGPLNILEAARWVFAASLIATPIVCLATNRLEQAVRLFTLNAFSQGLFCITLGTRETVAFGLGQCLLAGLLNSFILAAFLELPGAGLRMTRQDWVGAGRSKPWAVVLLLLGMSAVGGFPPFWGSLMVQRALGANTWWGLVLIINVLLSGAFLMRLTLLAFQRSPAMGDLGSPTAHGGVSKLSWHHGLWIGFQFALLIALGIVWHPLYKFALMSNRAFFGEL